MLYELYLKSDAKLKLQLAPLCTVVVTVVRLLGSGGDYGPPSFFLSRWQNPHNSTVINGSIWQPGLGLGLGFSQICSKSEGGGGRDLG